MPNSSDSGVISISVKESTEIVACIGSVETRQWNLEESAWKVQFVGVSLGTSWVGGLDEKMSVNENDKEIKTK